jgi:hypothetical protein
MKLRHIHHINFLIWKKDSFFPAGFRQLTIDFAGKTPYNEFDIGISAWFVTPI